MLPDTFEVVSRDLNNVIVKDLTNDAVQEYVLSRLRHFMAVSGVNVVTLAAANLEEAMAD